MAMPSYAEQARTGSERARVRRAIEKLGPGRVAKILQVNRTTATGFAAGAPVLLQTLMLICANLEKLERELELANR